MSPAPARGRMLERTRWRRKGTSARPFTLPNTLSCTGQAEVSRRQRSSHPGAPGGTAFHRRQALDRRGIPLAIGPHLLCHDPKRGDLPKVPGENVASQKNFRWFIFALPGRENWRLSPRRGWTLKRFVRWPSSHLGIILLYIDFGDPAEAEAVGEMRRSAFVCGGIMG
jgi:hypothetical protein